MVSFIYTLKGSYLENRKWYVQNVHWNRSLVRSLSVMYANKDAFRLGQKVSDC